VKCVGKLSSYSQLALKHTLLNTTGQYMDDSTIFSSTQETHITFPLPLNFTNLQMLRSQTIHLADLLQEDKYFCDEKR
jgi:hypothetical protein